MKANGAMIVSMARVKNGGPMALSSLATTKMVRRTVKVNRFGTMATGMKVSFRTMSFRALAIMYGKMVGNTLVSGLKVACTVMVCSRGPMDANTKELLSMT